MQNEKDQRQVNQHTARTLVSGGSQIGFDLRATLLANIVLQMLFIGIFSILKPSLLITLTAVITLVLYWTLAALAYFRKDHLSALEKIALRVGFGFFLPLAALIASSVLRNY